MVELFDVELELPGEVIARRMTLKELERLLEGLRTHLSQVGMDAAYAHAAIFGLDRRSYEGVDLKITIGDG